MKKFLAANAAKHLIEELKKTLPAVVDELVPGWVMKLAQVQQNSLQMLLREHVPIRNLAAIPRGAQEQYAT